MITLFLPCDNHDYFGAGSLFNLPLVWETRNPHPLVNTCVVVQSLSHVWLFMTPWTVACWASLSFIISQSLPKFMSIESMIHQTISSSVTSFVSCLQSFPDQGLFQWVSSLHQEAKVLEFQLQHQSFQWIIQDWFPLGLTGLISFLSKGFSSIFSSTTIQK